MVFRGVGGLRGEERPRTDGGGREEEEGGWSLSRPFLRHGLTGPIRVCGVRAIRRSYQFEARIGGE